MDFAALRILDANANRAREALRVMEDYARFALDDAPLCGSLKNVRHALSEVLRPYVAEAILHRDTPRDVGTSTKTEDERSRASSADVVIAAGKRLGEALRSIEEFLKTADPAAASEVESLRYRFYDIEQRLSFALVPSNRFDHVRLYVLITESCCKLPWLRVAEEAIAGGADCLQLREKSLDGGEFLRRARPFVELCRKHGVLSIINDRPDIAALSGADGVHVGQDDLPVREARKIVGATKIVGVSTHHIDQALQAVRDGADYIGVGPVFKSTTKPRDIEPGLPYAKQVAERIDIPAVAIAGITSQNIEQVLATGIKAVAVTSAVTGCADPRAAAMQLKAALSPVGQTFLSVTGGHSCPPVSPSSLRKTHRHLPHWTRDDATYFITFRLATDPLNGDERRRLFAHVLDGNGKFYELAAAVMMPDHGHAVLRPTAPYDLPRVMKGLKGASSRILNEMRGTQGAVWQDESMDRIIRDQRELEEKMRYVIENPVRAKLVGPADMYDTIYVNHEWW